MKETATLQATAKKELRAGGFSNFPKKKKKYICHVTIPRTKKVTPKLFHTRGAGGGVMNIYPLNTKRRLLYLKTPLVLRSKHFSSRL